MNEKLNKDFDRATEYLAQDKLEKARKVLQKMLGAAPEAPQTIELQGDWAMANKELVEAADHYRRLDRFADQPEVRGIGKMSLGFLLREDSPDEAIVYFQEAIGLFENTNKEYQSYVCQLTLGEIFSQKCMFEESLQTFESLIERLKENKDFANEEYAELTVDVLHQRGESLRYLGRLSEARGSFLQAITKAKRYMLFDGEASALDGLGVICQIQGLYEEAEQYHLQALTINQELEFSEGMSVNYVNLAQLFIHQKVWDRAEHYTTKAMKIDQANEDLVGVGICNLRLSDIASEKGCFDEALQFLQKAERIFNQCGTAEDHVTVHSYYGFIWRMQGRLVEAEERTLKALEMTRALKYFDGEANSLDEMAELRLAQSRPTEARSFWMQSLELYKQLRSIQKVEYIQSKLSQFE